MAFKKSILKNKISNSYCCSVTLKMYDPSVITILIFQNYNNSNRYLSGWTYCSHLHRSPILNLIAICEFFLRCFFFCTILFPKPHFRNFTHQLIYSIVMRHCSRTASKCHVKNNFSLSLPTRLRYRGLFSTATVCSNPSN